MARSQAGRPGPRGLGVNTPMGKSILKARRRMMVKDWITRELMAEIQLMQRPRFEPSEGVEHEGGD